ncbi:MAG: response regulator [Kiritimatiellae bacterium]|nr:response regulator [Kiritimatiellia bacterium]MDD5522720.1 response regulator [Kiritimatiellia bacterium]
MNRKIRVLIVEDSEDDTILLVRILRKGGYDPEYLRVDNAPSMTEALKSRSWDIIISDYSMPDFDGLKALKLVQKNGLDIPFIIVSGVIGENVAVAAMKAGAHDYLLKDNLKRLLPAIARELKEVADRKKRREAEKALSSSILEQKKQESVLKEKNIALKEILSQIESEKEEIKQHMTANVEKLLLPTLRELKRKGSSIDKHYIELLEKNLSNMTSGFTKTMRDRISRLSPRQLEICNMIKSGMKNKEIASLMGISLRTVETHRNAIRKKLGISGNDTNLTTFLNSPAQ